MRIMAIGTLKPLTDEQRKNVPSQGSSGDSAALSRRKMEQFWLGGGEAGVIFLMTVDSIAEADALLKGLPPGQANLLTFDLLPVGPLAPLGMLIG